MWVQDASCALFSTLPDQGIPFNTNKRSKMESQADLEGKIAVYTHQLSQVEELLQIETTPEFLKLKEDLVSLISLTKALLVQTIEASNPVNRSSSTTEVRSQEVQRTSAVTATSSSNVPKTGPIQVGEVVEVYGGERPFAGVVTTIVSESEYKIKYYEYPDEVSLPITSLHRLPLLAFSPEQIHVGLVCQCKYALDQKYYDCKVTAITAYGCNVHYTTYGNSEEVPLAYLKPTVAVAKAVPAERTGKSGLKPGADGLIAIPDSLTILPTDTEKEIEKKRKEVKSIKNKNRLASQHMEMAEAQNSWKKFVTKGAKRLDSGITKESMFSSTDEVGGKVGVVNSGKKMTDFGARKKHKFETF